MKGKRLSLRMGVWRYKKLTGEEERAGKRWSACCQTGYYHEEKSLTNAVFLITKVNGSILHGWGAERSRFSLLEWSQGLQMLLAFLCAFSYFLFCLSFTLIYKHISDHWQSALIHGQASTLHGPTAACIHIFSPRSWNEEDVAWDWRNKT